MDVVPHLVRPRSGNFGHAPTWKPGVQADILVLGCGTDFGMFPGGRSTAGSPRTIRQASHIIAPTQIGQGEGWYDYTTDEVLLKGVSIMDAGDISVDPLRSLEAMETLRTVINELARSAQLILLLGGDHSLTYWSCQAFADERPALLILDAHEDATACVGPYPNAGNVVSYLETSSQVSGIVQFGLRGLVPAGRRPPAATRRIERDISLLTRHFLEMPTSSLIVSLDVDVLDPTFLRPVASPSPEGLSPSGILDVVRAAALAGKRTRLLEIMEFAPETRDDPIYAFLIVQLTLRSLNALIWRQ